MQVFLEVERCCAHSWIHLFIQQIFIYMADTMPSMEYTVIIGTDITPALEELIAWLVTA